MITVKETVNWKLYMEKSMVFPQKSKTELLYDPAIFPGCLSIGIEISTLKRDLAHPCSL